MPLFLASFVLQTGPPSSLLSLDVFTYIVFLGGGGPPEQWGGYHLHKTLFTMWHCISLAMLGAPSCTLGNCIAWAKKWCLGSNLGFYNYKICTPHLWVLSPTFILSNFYSSPSVFRIYICVWCEEGKILWKILYILIF